MVVIRRTVQKRPQELKRVLTLKEFYEKHNKVLIIRGVGGLGDILMHRMIFEDFKLLAPDTEIHFACPWQYHDALSDHPFIDRILTLDKVKREDYILSYNTTTACGRYELQMAPYSGDHRSDIWANHCGVQLTRHEMHLQITEEEKAEGRRLIEKYRFCDGPSVLVAPISAMRGKNLSEDQMMGVIQGLRERGVYSFGMHTAAIYPFLKNDIPTICQPKLRQWLGVIDQVDYVISVDSATFHCAGGMKKPVVGIFTFINSEVYGRYYHTAELVQGPCEYGYNGCYNWGTCPAPKDNLPCHKNLSTDIILAAVDKMFKKYPLCNRHPI